MLERILRSPLLMIVVLIFVGVLYVGIQEDWSEDLLFYPFMIFLLLYFGLVLYHNKRNPEKKMKWITFTPYELREEDEGMQWITFKAARKVYIFYAFAIPFGIVLFTMFHRFIPHFTIWMLVAFGVIQYFIYWFEIRKVFQEVD